MAHNKIKLEEGFYCCCCFGGTELVSMLEPQYYDGNTEVYTSMITDCYGIQMDVNVDYKLKTLLLICKICISRLRNALQFRYEVQNAHNRIQDYLYKYTSPKIKMEVNLANAEYSDTDPLEIENNLLQNVKIESQSEREDNHSFVWINTGLGGADNVPDESNVEIEEENNTTIQNYKCDICDKKIAVKNNFLRHMRHHNDMQRSKKCDICGKTVKGNKYLYNRHLKIHSIQKEKEKKMSSFLNLENEDETLNNISSESINERESTFSNWENEDETLNNISRESMIEKESTMKINSDSSMRYKCPKCPERFLYFFQRTSHLIDVHNDETPIHKCKYCNKSFRIKTKLKNHIDNVHLKMKNCACDVCSMMFFSKSQLESHMLCHTGVKDFHCSVCRKSFARKKNLTQHLKIHNNIKNFVCVICDKAFVQKCSLTGHMKTHHKSEERS